MSLNKDRSLKEILKSDGLFLLGVAFLIIFVFTGGIQDKKKAAITDRDITRALSIEYSDEFKFGYELGKSAYYNGSDKYACNDYSGDMFVGCGAGYEYASHED